MKRKNMATMVTCIALVGAVTVGGTLALLTKESNTVTNSFTVGNNYANGALTLKESKVQQVKVGDKNFGGYEEVKPVEQVEKNDYENLVQGTTLFKNPTFYLEQGSPESWIVAYINNVDEAKADGLTVTKLDIEGEPYQWKKLDIATGGLSEVTTENLTDGYYVTVSTINADSVKVATDALFEQLTVGEKVYKADGDLPKITVAGVAVEAVNKVWYNASGDNGPIGDRDAVIAAVKGMETPPKAAAEAAANAVTPGA